MFSTSLRFVASGALLLITISASNREGGAQGISASSTTLTPRPTTSTTGQPSYMHKDDDKHNGGNGNGEKDHDHKDKDDDDDDDDEWWPILVGVLGGVAAAVLIAVIIVVGTRRHRKRQRAVNNSTAASLQQQQQTHVHINGLAMKTESEQATKMTDPPPAYPHQLRIDVESLTQSSTSPSAPTLPPPYEDNDFQRLNVHQHHVRIMPGSNTTIYENKWGLPGDGPAAK